jgi:hypothetical protein
MAIFEERPNMFPALVVVWWSVGHWLLALVLYPLLWIFISSVQLVGIVVVFELLRFHRVAAVTFVRQQAMMPHDFVWLGFLTLNGLVPF